MYNYFMMLFSAMSGIGAAIAVPVTMTIYRRQKRIALFDRRMKILNDFERFVTETLPNWGWDGNQCSIVKYSRDEVVALFDESFGVLQDVIIKTADECNMLIGDYNHAQRKGTCRGKTEFQIEQEKMEKEANLRIFFKEKRAEACRKWLRI